MQFTFKPAKANIGSPTVKTKVDGAWKKTRALTINGKPIEAGQMKNGQAFTVDWRTGAVTLLPD